MNDQKIARLAVALSNHSRDWYATPKTPADDWQVYMRAVLETAGIEVDDAQFERAWRTCWQRSFMGGTYTLDAKAILRAIEGAA